MYKKRLARHVQVCLAAERAGREAPERNRLAIENNRYWVEHYEALLQEIDQTSQQAGE